MRFLCWKPHVREKCGKKWRKCHFSQLTAFLSKCWVNWLHIPQLGQLRCLEYNQRYKCSILAPSHSEFGKKWQKVQILVFRDYIEKFWLDFSNFQPESVSYSTCLVCEVWSCGKFWFSRNVGKSGRKCHFQFLDLILWLCLEYNQRYKCSILVPANSKFGKKWQ